MQPRKLFAAASFLGSYLPLSIILMGQDLNFQVMANGFCSVRNITEAHCASPLKHTAISLITFAICLICFLLSLIMLKNLSIEKDITIVESKHIPADLINYVIPYVLSFISLDYGDPAKILGAAIFLLWLFCITYKSGQTVLNPMLTVIGWKLFDVKYYYEKGGKSFTGPILSLNDINPSETYKVSNLQEVMVIKRSGRSTHD